MLRSEVRVSRLIVVCLNVMMSSMCGEDSLKMFGKIVCC